MKAAPVLHALARRTGVRQTLVHTGQHYDRTMSDVFFQQLDLPDPDVNLAVGSGSHAQQTAEVMIRLEPVLTERKPDLVLVYGDVNSTVAAALVSAKLGIRIGHVEAGLRSGDRTMPEEINRLVTDQLADLLFTPSAEGNKNLEREGISPEKIFFVGNVMIDSLVRALPQVIRQPRPDLPDSYALVTLHRPSNVDDGLSLKRILQSLLEVSRKLGVVFPAHPRTQQRIAEFGLRTDQLRVIDPLPYLEFLAFQRGATAVITDSGGIQEETTYLGVPCITLRSSTERPVTVSLGTNVLVGQDTHELRSEVSRILDGKAKKGSVPPLWDGKAADRIAEIIAGKATQNNTRAPATKTA